MRQSVKNYIRLDKVPTTAHYESVVAEDEVLLNGQHIILGDVLNTAEGEEMAFEKAVAGGKYDAIVVPVYLTQGTLSEDIAYEAIEAGRPARALIPVKGDIISINSELAPDVNKGDSVAIGTDGLGYKVATGEEIVVGRAIDINFLRGIGNLTVIRLNNANA